MCLLIVKAFNTARSLAERKKPVEKPSAPHPPARKKMLLTEIRDLLKEKK
jgi:large-conductance mechanosensitive channel